MPPRREHLAPIAMPQTHTAADLKAAMAAIIAATPGGEILACEGSGAGAVIEVFRKALEMHDLARRLERLEQADAAAEGATHSRLSDAVMSP
jgi:hypothetical protein